VEFVSAHQGEVCYSTTHLPSAYTFLLMTLLVTPSSPAAQKWPWPDPPRLSGSWLSLQSTRQEQPSSPSNLPLGNQVIFPAVDQGRSAVRKGPWSISTSGCRSPAQATLTETQNSRGWKGPLWVI